MSSWLSELSGFGNFFFDFTFSNPAFYAALCIPTCVNTTFRLSTKGRNFGANIRTWVEISAQISCVIALGFANIVPLIILVMNNPHELSIKIFAGTVSLVYLYFVFGFVITDEEFEQYKSKLGIAFPPLGNRITKFRSFGFAVEVLLPTYVYMMTKYLAVGEFKVPGILSSLRV